MHYRPVSPDNMKVLYIDADPTNKDADRWGWSDKVYVLDVTAKKQEVLTGFPLNGRAQGGWRGRRTASGSPIHGSNFTQNC
jgi:hypothetical protein